MQLILLYGIRCITIADTHLGVIFTEEPQDVEVVCEVESSITFPCQYEGTTISPYWLLNSSLYPSSNPELPEDHSYNNNMLLVTNLDKKNGTTYQCIVLHQENGNICGYLSTAGRLTISCKGTIECYTVRSDKCYMHVCINYSYTVSL